MSDEGFSFSGYERDPLFMNVGGKKVMDISGVSGIDSVTDGRAAVFADFDNDGDTDILMTTIQGPGHLVFRNNVGSAARHVRITLKGDSRVSAIGAEVKVQAGGMLLTRLNSCGEGYLSQHDPRLLFGLGTSDFVDWIEVRWPDGKTERHTGPFAHGTSWLITPGLLQAPLPVSEQRARLCDPDSADNAVLRTLGLKVGGTLPPLLLADEDGQQGLFKVTQRTLINFWASWCTTCAVEMPELEALHQDLAAAGIALVGLAVDNPAGGLKKIAAERKLHYPLDRVVDAGPTLYPAGEILVPFTLLVDANGRIERAWRGWNHDVATEIRALTR